MLYAVQTTLLSWLSKAKLWAVAIGVLLVSAFTIASKISAAGRDKERLRTTEQTIKQYKKEVQIEATIRNLDASAARERLRREWRKR